MIKLINVSKSYKKRLLFENVNITIEKAGIYSFIGENGSGKTTILNIISKFIKPTRGKVINNFKTYSFISQKVKLINHLKVKEHFDMFKIDVNVLKKVRLLNKMDSYPTQLSQGQRQRIACLLAIYSNSSLLIADEPTSHLDEKSASFIIKELIKVSKRKIVILVSHDLEFIKKCSCQIYKIENNKINLIEERINNNSKINENKIMKFKFKGYIKKSLSYYKKFNLILCSIFFMNYLLLIFGFNFKSNIDLILDYSKKQALDYNKFYLKECEDVEEEILFKRCYNLKEEKLNVLKNTEHKVGYNYDVLLNNLFDTNLINVISVKEYSIDEGRYPLKYNEVVVSDDNYSIGDIITLNSSKVITFERTDIYKKTLNLEVVGKTRGSIIDYKESIYLDYDLINIYLKQEKLVNNNKSLHDYFQESDLNDYKYILFFNEVDVNLLKNNDIEYLSSSYEYYKNIEEITTQINNCLIYLNTIVVCFSFYYFIRLLKKKMKSKENEILFMKAMGVSNKKINKVITKEQIRLILIMYLVSFLITVIIFFVLFKTVTFKIITLLLIILLSLLMNKRIIKVIIKKRLNI